MERMNEFASRRRTCTVSRAAPSMTRDDRETANIKVDVGRLKGKAHTKYASAQDLRRAFGLRWSQRVMPAVLQQLMRHETIEATLRYYVGRDAEMTADLLDDIVGGGNTSGNTPQNPDVFHSDDSSQVVDT